jgi:nitrogen-specific signal transduction histidine kinase/CheY-like chemotaxis protein
MLPWKTASGEIGGIVIFSEDITARKRAEEALGKMQKLESLGVLAGGIAHDFNNLLFGIFGSVGLAAAHVTDATASSCLARALDTIERARGLTDQLLTFAKGGAPIKRPEQLGSLISETANFALSGTNVSCYCSIPDNLWTSDIDKSQIGQVIDNLVINAQQAMPEGGAITVTAENVNVRENEHVALSAGNYVKISIEDHGIGMPKQIIAKIFDPFFTTKPQGHGLGLATSYSIVKRHGGSIEVESNPGIGSTFDVYLPASADSCLPVAPVKDATNFRGSGTVVVMDDQEVVLETIREMLESFGYTVVGAKNGQEAINILAKQLADKRKITGIILDLTVPGGMGGREAILEIRKLDKEIPAIVSSGYSDDPAIACPTQFGFTASIRKPFQKNELAELLGKHFGPR